MAGMSMTPSSWPGRTSVIPGLLCSLYGNEDYLTKSDSESSRQKFVTDIYTDPLRNYRAIFCVVVGPPYKRREQLPLAAAFQPAINARSSLLEEKK